ncbi:hypothetical protein [Paenibacillus dokdonensis]
MSMQAVIIPHFGNSQVLALRDKAIPEPGPFDVTIDVAYAGINYAEVILPKAYCSISPSHSCLALK